MLQTIVFWLPSSGFDIPEIRLSVYWILNWICIAVWSSSLS